MAFNNRGSWFGQRLSVAGRTCGLIDVVTMRAPQPSVFDNPVVAQPSSRRHTDARPSGFGVPCSARLTLDLVQADGGSSPVLIPANPAVWRLAQGSEPDAASVRCAGPIRPRGHGGDRDPFGLRRTVWG